MNRPPGNGRLGFWYWVRVTIAEGCLYCALHFAHRVVPEGYLASIDQAIDEARHTNLRDYTDDEIATEYFRRAKKVSWEVLPSE